MKSDIKSVLSGYSKLSPYYDKIFYYPKKYDEKTVEYLDKLFSSNSVTKVLDCACGTGNPSLGLILKGYKVILSDGNKKMVQKAIENAKAIGLKNLDIYICDWFNLTKKFHNMLPFDAVICSGNSFYHLPDSFSRLFALENMRRLLKNGGILYLDYPDWGKERRFKVYDPFTENVSNIVVFRIIEYQGNMRNHYFYILKEAKRRISLRKIFIPGWKFSDQELFQLCRKAGFTSVQPVSYTGPHKHKAIIAKKG